MTKFSVPNIQAADEVDTLDHASFAMVVVPTVEFVFIRVGLFDTAIVNDYDTLLFLQGAHRLLDHQSPVFVLELMAVEHTTDLVVADLGVESCCHVDGCGMNAGTGQGEQDGAVYLLW